jgi:formate hydrogenlyase transcriptional activator
MIDNWKVGTPVSISDPQGNFYFERMRDAKSVIALAGGSGITPFLSMAYSIKDGAEDFDLTVLFGSRTGKDILFEEEFDEICAVCPKVRLINVLSDEKKDGYENGFITAELIKKYKPLRGAYTESAVLIYGETGTGKELIARAVHNLSTRKASAFVKLNCAAIPTGLLESELFGHERGAFTGAMAQRVGRFELAHKGTIFLDEIGEIPLELQPKLLRVLQEREFERLGSSRTLRSDARLIAATNRDLGQMVEEGKFRADLYYRLNVFPVRVPPLRERPEDIPLLVRHFVHQFSRRNDRLIESIPSQTMDLLMRYHWPGNVRELQNIIERAVIVSKGSVLRVPTSDLKAAPPPKSFKKPDGDRDNLRGELSDRERTRIIEALEQSNCIVAGPAGAAARLGMKRSTLQFRMAKLGIHISRVGGVSPTSE